MHYRFIAIVLITLSVFSCQLSTIPLKDSEGNKVREIFINTYNSHITINIPPLPDKFKILTISMTQPTDELQLEYLNKDNEIITEKSLVPSLSGGQTILDFQFSLPQGVKKIRIRSEIDHNLPTVLSVSYHENLDGLVLDSYRILLPENMSYRQEVRSSLPGNDSLPIIFQEVHIDERFWQSENLKFLPTLELSYEYDLSDNSMPIIEGEFNIPTARLDLLTSDSKQIKSWELKFRPGRHSVYIYPETLLLTPAIIRLSHSVVSGRLQALRLIKPQRTFSAPSLLEPLPVDLGTLLNYSSAMWRTDAFELFSWNLFPQLLIFDFADLSVQARFFKRLAYYVEKQGFTGQLLYNDELSGRHGWNAHNYNPSDLALFYNKAEGEGFELNPEEVMLRDILLFRKVLLVNEKNSSSITLPSKSDTPSASDNGNVREKYLPGEGQIISITQHPLQSKVTREYLLRHEALHGLFYNLPGFEQESFSLWADLSADTRTYFSHYMSYFGYDTANEYLMVNEFQAYMLQQPLEDLRWIVEDRMPARILRHSPQLQPFLNRVKAEVSNELIAAAQAMENFMYQQMNFVTGDLSCLVELELLEY